MTYPTTGAFAAGPAALPNLVGGRVEAALEYGRMNSWTVHERHTEPVTKDQPDGLVIAQQPAAGAVLDPGDVVLVDVIRRVPFAAKHAATIWGSIAAVLAVLSVVFLVVILAGDGGGDGDAAELAIAQARITELEAQVAAAAGSEAELVATLQAQLAEATARAEQAEADLAAQTETNAAAIATLTAERDALVVERDQLLQRVAELEAELGGITAQVIATPEVVGQQRVAVEEFVRLNSIELVIDEVDTVEGVPVEPGTVVAQVPAAGIPLVKGSVLVITVYVPPA
ncbi:MAG: hypothetical protein RI958_2719 [Actinomycetota bacterium]|jgi:hypothetical protein